MNTIEDEIREHERISKLEKEEYELAIRTQRLKEELEDKERYEAYQLIQKEHWNNIVKINPAKLIFERLFNDISNDADYQAELLKQIAETGSQIVAKGGEHHYLADHLDIEVVKDNGITEDDIFYDFNQDIGKYNRIISNGKFSGERLQACIEWGMYYIPPMPYRRIVIRIVTPWRVWLSKFRLF